MARSNILRRVLAQVDEAKAELKAYAPDTVDWHARALQAASDLVPWLSGEAPGLQRYVEDVLNSPTLVREEWAVLKQKIGRSRESERIDELLSREGVLLEFVAGDTVSMVVTGYLVSRFSGGQLVGNSKSDYPDLFLRNYDYSKLPARTRDDKEIGAAVRGKEKKPVRVPDGLEIKTSRDGANIDCHFPHVGLHLMLSFQTTGDRVVVDDVLVAFLRAADYRITQPRTKATTLKASFTRAPFVTLLHE